MAPRYRRPLLRGLTYALAIVLVPLLAGVAGLALRIGRAMLSDPNPPAFNGQPPAPPLHDPEKPTAVVIAANSGTEGSDFLAPYAVLGTSGAFNLYAVAPERRITHLFPGGTLARGVDVLPHYSFAEYETAIGSDPDLIVIPYMPNTQVAEYATIITWIRAHAGPHTLGSSHLGVALYPGMSELALASVVDTYPHQGTLTVDTVAPSRTVVLSQHGLALIPRWSFADAPRLDRIILPGRDSGVDTVGAFERWAQERYQLPVERVHEAGGYVYDITFNDMARRAGRIVTNEAIYLLEYPLGPSAAPLYPLGLVARVVALGFLGLGLAIALDRPRAARERRAPAETGHLSHHM